MTVCITNHDYVDFVGTAIASALAQGHPDTEIVVVDDGSTDTSLTELEKYRDLVTLVAKPNGGQASAINAGFAESTGEGVLFLDADDVLLPGALRRIEQRFREDADTVKVAVRMAKIDAHGDPIGTLEPACGWRLPEGDMCEHVLRRRSYVWPASSGNAYRRRALEQVLPIPEEPYRVEADLYLAVMVPVCGHLAAVDEQLVGYRIHGSNCYADRSLDAAFFRQKLRRIEIAHQHLDAWVQDAGGAALPRVEQVADPAYLSYRVASAVLDPAAHPHPGDRWRRSALRGAVLAARHPGHPIAARFRRSAWFTALALAPRNRAVQLVRLRF